MRTEKFQLQENYYNGDDIHYAFHYNALEKKLQEIDVIVAEVCGENDGVDWYWILQMKDGTFAMASGGCDYTGWDCQSWADIQEGFKTPEEAIESVPINTFDHRKSIKECLKSQIDEEIPFALYQAIDSHTPQDEDPKS